jgi:hypothetical protein
VVGDLDTRRGCSKRVDEVRHDSCTAVDVVVVDEHHVVPPEVHDQRGDLAHGEELGPPPLKLHDRSAEDRVGACFGSCLLSGGGPGRRDVAAGRGTLQKHLLTGRWWCGSPGHGIGTLVVRVGHVGGRGRARQRCGSLGMGGHGGLCSAFLQFGMDQHG